MQWNSLPKLLVTIRGDPHDIDDGDGSILIGPASAILDDGKTLGLNLVLARPPGPLLAMQIVPPRDGRH